jgi:hypothetical protein
MLLTLVYVSFDWFISVIGTIRSFSFLKFDIDVCGLYLYIHAHVIALTYQLFDFVNGLKYDSIDSY